MANIDYANVKYFDWRAGLPAELWLSMQEVVRGFIARHELQPLATQAYPMDTRITAVETIGTLKSLQEMKLWPKPYPGGIRAPHLHFDGDVFILDRNQWREFSTQVVRDVRSRLARVKSLDFEQTLELSEAARRL